MTELNQTTLSLPQAARRLGVSVRTLRQAVRHGQLTAPVALTATGGVPEEWVASTAAALEATPGLLARRWRQTVPAFARFEGTSFFHKYRVRARAYERHKVALGAKPG